MALVLVTGGAGFIGSHIVADLAAQGTYRPVVCDRFGDQDKWRNLRHHGVEEVVPPSEVFYWLEMHEKEVDAIVHMGAISSTTERDADALLEVNFALSSMLWRWASEHKKRFIYASTAATYGDGSAGFNDDESLTGLNTLRPLNPYGWSKHMFDRFACGKILRNEARPLQWVGLKFFNVYGPNEYHKDDQMSVICKFAPHAAHGHTLKLFKSYHPDFPDGGQIRDFIYVRDCARLVSWLLENPSVNGLYNAGTGTGRTFDDVARAIFTALGKEPHITYIDMPENLIEIYQYFTQANMQKLRAAGYPHPFTSLEDGVRDYVQNYLMQHDPYY